MKTNVVFLRDNDGCPYCGQDCNAEAGCDGYMGDVDGLLRGSIFAVFPAYRDCVGRPYLMTCYAFDMQHSRADFDYCCECDEVTDPDEYNDLLVELGRVGYDVCVVRKSCINDFNYTK